MKACTFLIVPFFLLAFPVSIGAQTFDEIDPVSVSPEIFRVILENEHVRVIEYTLAPGQRNEWHTHPAKVSYVLDQGGLRIIEDNGNSFLTLEQYGAVSWMDSLGRHYEENVGQTPVRILFLEIKAANRY